MDLVVNYLKKLKEKVVLYIFVPTMKILDHRFELTNVLSKTTKHMKDHAFTLLVKIITKASALKIMNLLLTKTAILH